MKRIRTIRRGMAALLVLLLAGQAWAGNVALRAGFTPAGYSTGKFTYDSGSDGTTCYNTDGATPLAGNFAVECYWVGSNGNFNDPGYGDDVLVGTVKYVGNDDDTWYTFQMTAGKFYHDYTGSDAQFTSGDNIYIRVWNNATVQAGGAYFGESNLVSASYDGNVMPLPTNNGLNDTSTVLAQTTPEAPTLGTVTPHQAAAGGSPSITINVNSAIHGRWYEFEVSSPEAESGATFVFNGYKTDTEENTRHAADVNTGSTKSSTITLNQTHDDTWVKVRARAVNDYGPGAWVVGGPYYIPKTPDPNIPVAVTDLQVSQEGSNLILSWSAPYDENRYGSQTDCVQYDIRVANQGIVDLPVSPFSASETNPLSLTNWSSAISIEVYFTPAPTIPTPTSYGTQQNTTITGASIGTPMHFAIKSADESGNWSYVSNIAALGGGGGTADDLLISFTSGGDVQLDWSGTAGTYEIWVAASDEVFTLQEQTSDTTYVDVGSSAIAERYYQVRVPGGQSAPQIVGKYTFNFVKTTGSTGINTFGLPFATQVRGRNNAIDSADDVITDIGVDYVEYVGQWSDALQQDEGRVVYTANPANWAGPDFSLSRGKSYQISISENRSWSIVGRK